MKLRSLLAVLIVLAALVLPTVPTPISLAQPEVLTELNAYRTRNTKTYQVSTGGYRQIVIGAPVHYQVNGTWQNIDNSWIPATLPWNWKMTSDAYQAYALSNFAAGQSLMFTYNGSSVAYQPMAIEWTNNLNQVSQISMPVNVPVTINNTAQQPLPNTSTYTGVIRWDDAYGEGRHFEWNAQPGKLKETVQLDSLPPAPPQYIIDGGSPVLRHNFIFSPSSDLEIWVNGALWDKSTRVVTVSRIEFRKNGNTLWVFEPVLYWDSNVTNPLRPPMYHVGTTEMRKSGNNLYISTRIPYEWLQTAVYPVFIDPTKTYQPNASAGKDNYIDNFHSTTNYGTSADLISGAYWDFEIGQTERWRSLIDFTVNWTELSGYAITSATLSLKMWIATGSYAYTASRILRTTWTETGSDWEHYVSPDSHWTTYGCDSNGNDYTVTNAANKTITATGWNSWTVTALIEYFRSVSANPTFRIAGGATGDNYWYAYSSDYGTSGDRPKLEINYVTPPALHTHDATNVLSTTATLNGEVTDDGGNTNNVSVTFYWGDHDGGTDAGSWHYNGAATSPSQPQGVAAFSRNIDSLTPSTLYYYRAKAVNLAGTTWSTPATTFTTASACTPSITTSPTTKDFGVVAVNSNYSTGLTYFNTTNDNSGGAVIISIHGHNLTGGGYTWNLSDTATAGNMIYGLTSGLSGQSYNVTVKQNETYNTLIASLANNASQLWGLNLYTPTTYTVGDNNMKSGTITLSAACL